MCGILLTTRACSADDRSWRRALAVLECRGPDAAGEVHSPDFAAGHTRLAIIGLGDAGRQPYSTDTSDDVLVYNGEIYNYRELAAQIGVEALSDTQVLFEILRQRRMDLLSALRGMFAFVYRRAAPEEIIAGRDFFGIKPLFMARGPEDTMSFASVTSALLPISASREVDPAAVAGFLATGYFAAGQSAVAGIEKLPEGSITSWCRDGTGWNRSSIALSIAGWPLLPVAQAVDDSVRAHLVSDVPVGVLLSGGVDSTLIAARASTMVADLRTYSLVNTHAPSIDEASYARWNSSIIGTQHTEVEFEPARAFDDMTELIRTSGEPFGDAGYLPLAMLCRRVATDLKVVLAGEGADELFGGYRRYEVERLRGRRVTGASLGLASKLIGGVRRYETVPPTAKTRSWASWGETDDYLAHSYLLSAEWRTLESVLPGSTQHALANEKRAWAELGRGERGLGMTSQRAFDVMRWMPNVFLEKSDRASMVHGVEVRVPFLDPVVARAAMQFPYQDTKKAPLRAALHSQFPGIRFPPQKMGLSVDLAGLLRSPRFADQVDFALDGATSVLNQIGLVRPGVLRTRAALNPALAFRLATLAIWQRQVLEQQS